MKKNDCNITHNGYWIEGVTRFGIERNAYWTYHDENHRLYSKDVSELLSKMKARGIDVNILSEQEYSKKLYDITFVYDGVKFKRRNNPYSFNGFRLSLSDFEFCVEKWDEDKSFSQNIYYLRKNFPQHCCSGFSTLMINYLDGLVELPQKQSSTAIESSSSDESEKKLIIPQEQNISEGTITDTLSVDLTKQATLDVATHSNLEERINVLEGKIDWLIENNQQCNCMKSSELEEKSWIKRKLGI